MCEGTCSCNVAGDPKQEERKVMAKEIAAILAKHKVKVEDVRWVFDIAMEYLVVALKEE